MKSELEKNSSKPINKKFWISVTILVVCAAAIRLIYFFTFNPPLTPFTGDSPAYDLPAWNILQGHGYTDTPGQPFANREPGYALLILAPTYAIFGHSFLAVLLVQYVLDIMMMVLLMWFLYRKVNLGSAVIAGALYVLYLPFVFQNGEILTEMPYQLCLMISMGIFIMAIHKQSRWLMVVTGAFIGYTALVRWGAFMLPPFLILSLWAILGSWKKMLHLGAYMLIGTTIVVSPWIIRNYIVFDQFIFGRISGGEIYWSGSYIPYDGEWAGNTPESLAVKEGLTLLEYDKKFTHLAIENIKSDPVQVMWIWLKKPFKIYILPEAINYLNIEGRGPFVKGGIPAVLLMVGSVVLHWIILFAGIIGLWKSSLPKSIRYSFAGLLIFSVLIYMPLNPVSRYNVPVMPFFIILAAPILYTGCMNIYARYKKI